jgi:hypothetical protein
MFVIKTNEEPDAKFKLILCNIYEDIRNKLLYNYLEILATVLY